MSTPLDARFELKFVAPETAYHELESWLVLHSDAFYRPFPRRRVNNVYFDGHELDSYAQSVAGVSSRVKVRYRWYGDHLRLGRGQLEIKVRRNRLGWKFSYAVSELAGPCTSWGDARSQILGKLPPDARRWLVEYCSPVIINSYERDYWATRSNGIRATIDRNQSVYDQRYSSEINTNRKMNVRQVLLEVKGPVEASKKISRLVASLRLPLSRHSKYCSAVDMLQGL